MIRKEELLFKNLFERALKDWPKEIVFGKLVCYETPRFIIEGLGELSDEIEHAYINCQHEVIMRDLHCSIYISLHDLAKFIWRIKLEDLRPETVQREFEARMKSSLEDPQRWNWKDADVQLIKDYFTVNGSFSE